MRLLRMAVTCALALAFAAPALAAPRPPTPAAASAPAPPTAPTRPAAPTAPDSGELRLVYHLTQTEISHGKSGVGPAEMDRASADVTVGLGGHYVYERGSFRPEQLDFARRTMRSFDDSLHTYTEAPLVAVVDYREMELSSRIAMMAALAAVKPKAMVIGSLMDSEAELGMKSADRKASDGAPKLEKTPGASLWRFGSDTATVCAFSDTALTPAQEAMFGRYLLYFCKVHPEVRTALLAQHRLPRRLLYRWNLLGTVTVVEMDLVRMEAGAETAMAVPAGFTRRAAFDSTLNVTLGLVGDSLSRCRAAAANVYGMLESGRQAAQQGRALDALLGFTEFKLMTCAEPPSADSPTQNAIRKDARAKSFSDGVEKISKRKLPEARRILEGIDLTGLEKRYLMDLELATLDQMQGNSRGAVEKFQRALRANPCLVGAWTDLGMVYLINFDTIDGWICMSAARQAAPQGCSLLKQVDDRERELMAKHPEYF